MSYETGNICLRVFLQIKVKFIFLFIISGFRICSLYEAACKKLPNNEELLCHLFMAYVRVNEYKKQQQTALAIYKLKPKNPYYFWSVISLVLQVSYRSFTGNHNKKKIAIAV